MIPNYAPHERVETPARITLPPLAALGTENAIAEAVPFTPDRRPEERW